MSIAISASGLSKEYRIGERVHGAMLRDRITSFFKRPLRPEEQDSQSLWALRNVSFEIEQNEVVGLIGHNGAGKTTLLKLLAGITYPTEGELHVEGRIASLVEVGTGFHPELTGRENVFLNGSILGLRKREIEKSFDDIVEFAGVARFIDTPIKRYSTGMRLRLGFAVAAHLSTEVLLVDEVLAVGDVDFQRRCLSALDGVRERGRTVMFVSHNLEAVERLCPRTLWIDGGGIRSDGPTREVISAYLSAGDQRGGMSLDLSGAEPRSGSGEIRFTGLDFLDLDQAPKAVIRSGDSVKIRVSYTVERPLRSPAFGVMVATDLGTLVAHFNTWSDGLELETPPRGDGSLDLTIRGLNLMPGRYPLTLWIQRQGEPVIDLLEHCTIIEIHPGSANAGQTLPRRSGLVFFDCSWEQRLPDDSSVSRTQTP